MPDFRDLSSLYNYIQSQLDSAMENEVADVVTEVMKEHIQKDVYDVYTPHPEEFSYTRTFDLLKDVETKLIDIGTIELKDTRNDPKHPNKDIVNIIETGKGYTWGIVRDLNEEIGARPFVENTYEQLNADKTHVITLKMALESKGIQTE